MKMNTVAIFFILFFGILIILYPIIRIVYFGSSKKVSRNKILNLLIMIFSFIITYFIIRSKINNILKIDLGNFINNGTQIALIIATIVIGSVAETIINTITNILINRRKRNR